MCVCCVHAEASNLRGDREAAADHSRAIQASMRGEMSDLRDDNAMLKICVRDLQAAVVLAHNKVEALESEVQDLRGQVVTSQGQTTQVRSQLADAMDQLATKDGKIASLEGNAAEEARKRLSTALAKPPFFEGKVAASNDSGDAVRDWVDTVKRYVDAVEFTDADAVRFAASYLRGQALAAWNLRAAALATESKPVTLEEFTQALVLRFGGPAQEADARMKLDRLKQEGKLKSLRAYLAEFERLCERIPDMRDGEKVHRFLSGLQTGAYMRALNINPATLQRYDTFADMRRAAETLAASSGVVDDVNGALNRHGQRREQQQQQNRQGGQPPNKKHKGEQPQQQQQPAGRIEGRMA